MNDILTKTIQFGGLNLEFGRGGIHGAKNGTFRSDAMHVLINADVASMYPNIILAHKVKPRHLPEEFLTVYQSLVSDRMTAKRAKDKFTADALKLVINSSFGKYNNASADRSYASFLFDPQACFGVTVRGQLLLAKLAEMLYEDGAELIQCNTDGIMVRIERTKRASLEQRCKEWESLARLELEFEELSHIYQVDVNNYIEVRVDGTVKAKGKFAAGAGNQPAVVGFSCQNQIQTGDPVAKFIENMTNPRAFLMPLTIRKPFEGVLGKNSIGNVARFYHSTKGKKLYKRDGSRTIAVGGFDRVAIAETLPAELPRDLDVAAYVAAAEGLLGISNQLELFSNF